MKLLGPSIWMPIIMLIWGVIAMSTAAVRNAGAFGGLMAYGIVQIKTDRNYRFIFLLEGAPSIILAVIAFCFLGDLPETVKWLSPTERELVTNRLRNDAGTACNTRFSWKQVKDVFIDWKVYFYMFICLGIFTPMYSLSIFLPSIVKGMGYSNVTAQAMSAPPFVISALTTIAVSFHAGRKNERGYHIGIFLVMAIIGFIMLITLSKTTMMSNCISTDPTVAMYIATVIACIGTYTTVPLHCSWFTNNIDGTTKRGVATGLIVGFGNLGGVIAGQIYRDKYYPDYRISHSITLGFICVTLALVIILKILLIRENRRRANLTIEQYELECSRDEPLDWHPDVIYVE
ncbi:unnamed protein product [Didymodactylos carnosus]|uniref:Uncharacterized protein n=1 Tax=Didymodactylos carnosus TaxID=1234261 RepID=A0A814FQV0_9BILA|nr:unnamed protein product [Didymodactylos carnosus]CAF3758545.1 unnamed protein product [Didymodactylos carnosus]